MKYFIFCRDKPGTLGLRMQLLDAHWSFMDSYSDRMLARGPTLTTDRETPTGSLHIVDLASEIEARTFAFEEPNYAAGVYDYISIFRWQSPIKRNMWEFEGGSNGSLRYLVIAYGKQDQISQAATLSEEFSGFLRNVDQTKQLIMGGELVSDDGQWQGTALIIEAHSPTEVLLLDDPYRHADRYLNIEIHPWRFGGRPTR